MSGARVRKAVFPVAGLGTRFLPATKAMPKEMLPVVDKPLIQYAVEEAAAAGIEQMIFVTGRGKRAIEDHFDRAPELEQTLDAQRKHELLQLLLSATPAGVSFVYVRQPEPLGLGHAVLCAEQVVGDEPFAVILADDLIDATPGVTAQLIESFRRTGASVLAVEEVPPQDVSKYGIVAAEPLNRYEARVTRIVEKPRPEEAPSTLAVVGRYVLRPEIFIELAHTPRGRGGEIQLTDASARRVARGEVIARRFEGTRYDCGSKEGFLRANIAFGRKGGLIG
ncbi:MAG: UTP--glucose-1-phosphate uridylyltransferase GalU [Sutterellaceae bacterium]|nr:UTP--glucose-1-phosphate uridylyltransferase GalU [Burkholderiaceae bacterium]MDW8430604.1 UTP--glucose-1-phosphate uridylyltransferase GalU [Sutterellaceae bacterium]